jgi:hypothetical protein
MSIAIQVVHRWAVELVAAWCGVQWRVGIRINDDELLAPCRNMEAKAGTWQIAPEALITFSVFFATPGVVFVDERGGRGK